MAARKSSGSRPSPSEKIVCRSTSRVTRVTSAAASTISPFHRRQRATSASATCTMAGAKLCPVLRAHNDPPLQEVLAIIRDILQQNPLDGARIADHGDLAEGKLGNDHGVFEMLSRPGFERIVPQRAQQRDGAQWFCPWNGRGRAERSGERD